MHKEIKLLLIAGAFILLLVLAVFTYHWLSKSYDSEESSDGPLQEGSSLAPDFTVKDEKGNDISLNDFKGKPVVLNFWTSWCTYCVAEMPEFETIYQEYQAQGVVFMMVNLTDGSRETQASAQQFVKDHHYTFPIYYDLQYQGADAYNISAIPASFFIDKDGKIAAAYRQPLNGKILKQSIELILK